MAGGFREGERGRRRDEGDRGRWKKWRWKEDRAEPRGLGEPHVTRHLRAGEQSTLYVQTTNITTELCVLCTGLLRLEIYHNKALFTIYSLWKHATGNHV